MNPFPKLLPLLLLTGLVGGAAPQAPPAIEGEASRAFQISVNVDLVVLNATVREQKGLLTADLREQDFEVYEDGVRQSIRLFRHEDLPVTVGLVVDHSGSMRVKLKDVIAAARTFVQSSSPQDEMFVVNFNEKVTLGLPDAIPFTNHAEVLARAISTTPADGKTALYDAVAVARERVQAGSRDKKVLVVVSDGADTASTHTLAQVLKMAEHSGVLVYTIGVFDPDDQDRNPGVLRRLAHATGGEAFFPTQLTDVVSICERLAREIRNQYTIGYVSSNPAKPGAYRSIRVVARGAANSKLSVRTRAGYTIGAAAPPPVKDEAAK